MAAAFGTIATGWRENRAMRDGHDIHARKAIDDRVTIHSSDLLLLEDYSAAGRQAPVAMLTNRYQVHFPYFGAFGLTAGSARWVFDPNMTLFVSPRMKVLVDHPDPDIGHSALVITPSRQVLDEVCLKAEPDWKSVFTHVRRTSTPRTSLLVHQLRHICPEIDDPLTIDECAIHALRLALAEPPCTPSTRVIGRAKEVLHGRSCERLTLGEIAREVGVTPVYLTQEFSRSQGVPLYRYQMRLRLNRGLLELPHCADITGLALDLGFSSHSHFTAVFRREFGLTPSDYRSSVIRRRGDASTTRLLRDCPSFQPRCAA